MAIVARSSVNQVSTEDVDCPTEKQFLYDYLREAVLSPGPDLVPRDSHTPTQYQGTWPSEPIGNLRRQSTPPVNPAWNTDRSTLRTVAESTVLPPMPHNVHSGDQDIGRLLPVSNSTSRRAVDITTPLSSTSRNRHAEAQDTRRLPPIPIETPRRVIVGEPMLHSPRPTSLSHQTRVRDFSRVDWDSIGSTRRLPAPSSFVPPRTRLGVRPPEIRPRPHLDSEVHRFPEAGARRQPHPSLSINRVPLAAGQVYKPPRTTVRSTLNPQAPSYQPPFEPQSPPNKSSNPKPIWDSRVTDSQFDRTIMQVDYIFAHWWAVEDESEVFKLLPTTANPHRLDYWYKAAPRGIERLAYRVWRRAELMKRQKASMEFMKLDGHCR